MKRRKSKLDLESLQQNFDAWLDNLTDSEIRGWKIKDELELSSRMFSGQKVDVEIDTFLHYPISCGLEDSLYKTWNNNPVYDNAA